MIFAEGSAGTVQEIFQDAAFNYYAPARQDRPMVFLGKTYWTKRLPVIPLLKTLFRGHHHPLRLLVTDDPDKVVTFLCTRPTRNGPRGRR